MKLKKLAAVTFIGTLTFACEGGKYSNMSKAELKEKQQHCDSIKKKSTVFATGCENVRKEIERRKRGKN